MGHFEYTMMTALAFSAARAAMGSFTPRERVYRGVYLFVTYAAAVFSIGWAMRWVNG